MNKQELEKKIKETFKKDVCFDLVLIDKKVYFQLMSYDYREVCLIGIPYKNNEDRKEIYKAILSLIECFDFSFRVSFDSVAQIEEFLK